MKNYKFISALLAVIVAFAITSCTTSQGPYDETYDRSRVGDYEVTRQVGNRLYVDDPYRGTIILERDPYTGRYYDVTNSYGVSSPYTRYNTYGSRGYRTYNNNIYRNTTPRTNTPAPQQPQRGSEDWQKSREEARKRVLGN